MEAAKRAAAIAFAIEEAGVGSPTPPPSRATSPVDSNTAAPSTSGRSEEKFVYVEDSNDEDDEIVDATRENARNNPNLSGKLN